MIKWLEGNTGAVICAFCVIFLLEVGVGVWRLPEEYKHTIMPKLHTHISQYQGMIDKVDYAYNQQIYLEGLYGELKERIKLLEELSIPGESSEEPDTPIHYLPLPPANSKDLHTF